MLAELVNPILVATIIHVFLGCSFKSSKDGFWDCYPEGISIVQTGFIM